MSPDHYETLGLPPSSTPEEVKKRYRSLARRYHPDVNSNPDAAQKITRINEAYHILGDADRRALYDAERMLRTPPQNRPTPRPAERPAPRSGAAKPEFKPRPAAPSSPARSRPMEYNGFGRTPAAGSPEAAAPKKPDTASRAANAFRDMDRFIVEAQLAFINRQYREAEDLCMKALQVDQRNAVAHEILGDIFLKRGQTDGAVKAYSYAVQFNPRNLTVQAKLERLMGRRSVPASRPDHDAPGIGFPLESTGRRGKPGRRDEFVQRNLSVAVYRAVLSALSAPRSSVSGRHRLALGHFVQSGGGPCDWRRTGRVLCWP